jgi:hypothetical protein
MQDAQPIPAPLLAAFADRVSIGAPETAKLLGLDEKTLRGHVRRGNIRYLSIGFGEKRPRREFRLADILEFLERMSRRECPSTAPRTRRSTTSTSSSAVIGFTARRAALIAEKQKQSSGQKRRG